MLRMVVTTDTRAHASQYAPAIAKGNADAKPAVWRMGIFYLLSKGGIHEHLPELRQRRGAHS